MCSDELYVNVRRCGGGSAEAVPLNVKLTSGGSKEVPGTRTNYFIFMQFLKIILQNNRLAHPFQDLALPSGNPRSVTAYNYQICAPVANTLI